MLTTVGINLSTSSAKLSGAFRAGCATAGCANAKPSDTAATTAADLKTPGKSVRITSDLQRRSGLNGSERPAPRVRVPVYMAADCGANKEVLMLLIVSAFPRPLRKIDRRRCRTATTPSVRFLSPVFQRYFLAAG